MGDVNRTEFEELKTTVKEVHNERLLRLEIKFEQLLTAIGDLTLCVKGLQSKPADRWNKLIEVIITISVGAFIMWVIKGGK